jgi:hypothetical protein
MTQQIEVEPTKIRARVRDARRAGASEREHNPHSAKRVITTFIVALAFAFAVIVGLVYMINSAAYQSTDDAFIDGHIVPVSAQVAGRVQSVYVDDNQSVSKALLVLELDPAISMRWFARKLLLWPALKRKPAPRKLRFKRRSLISRQSKQPSSQTRQLPPRMLLRMIKLRAT